MYATYCRLRVPVWASAREVIRAAKGKLSKQGLSRARRADRHAFYRHMLEYHRNAQELCREFRI